MAELTNIAAEISKGKKLDDNLSRYAAGMNLLYKRIAQIKLALNMFSFAQVYGEDDGFGKTATEFANRFADIVKNCVLSEKSSDESDLSCIDSLRNEIMAKMEVLTSYVDRLSLYEYALNRVEYRFKEADITPQYYDDKFEKDILKYIASDTDQTVVNSKICDTVGQLPMRLSKNKFYDILANVFTLYKGAEVKSLDDFIYMIRSHAGIYTPDGFESDFPFLYESINNLSAIKYAEITSEQFDEASNVLYDASEYVNSVTDIYVMLMDSVNDAYTYMLSSDATLDDANEKQACMAIIEEACNAVSNADLPSEEIFDKFVLIEGVQEKLFMQLSKDGYALDAVKESYLDTAVNVGLEKAYDKMFKCELLNSGSSFVGLDSVASTVIADEKTINDKLGVLLKEFAACFEGLERPITRAVMANVLSGLPVFFNNQEELKEYIHVALNQCNDQAERQGVMHIMQQLFDEE